MIKTLIWINIMLLQLSCGWHLKSQKYMVYTTKDNKLCSFAEILRLKLIIIFNFKYKINPSSKTM